MKITRRKLKRIIKEEIDLAVAISELKGDNPHAQSIGAGRRSFPDTTSTLAAIKSKVASGEWGPKEAFESYPLLVFADAKDLAGILGKYQTVTGASPGSRIVDSLKAEGVPVATDWASVQQGRSSSTTATVDVDATWPSSFVFAIQVDVTPAARALTAKTGGDESYQAVEPHSVKLLAPAMGNPENKVRIVEAKIHSGLVDAVLETARGFGVELDRPKVAGEIAADIVEESPLTGEDQTTNRYAVSLYNRS